MANLPSMDTQLAVASEAATAFVSDYYEALNRRQPLAQYYASASKHLTAASVKPDISINGRVVDSVADYEAMLDAQGANVSYEVHSFDAHPINATFTIGCPDNLSTTTDAPGRGKVNKSVRDGDRISFAIQVSGTVRYGKPAARPAAGTTTTPAAKVPNADDAAAKAKSSRAPIEVPAVSDTPLEKAFTESWLLVPHWESLGRNAPRGLRKWLVVSQNFRAL
ncbi:nuclear transport factor 2 domain-containing protein [Xylariaceae sp. FL0594]|nr:nuclear transport factor 2 domain-containing protein [Xylariaceae sp. FL0594]